MRGDLWSVKLYNERRIFAPSLLQALEAANNT